MPNDPMNRAHFRRRFEEKLSRLGFDSRSVSAPVLDYTMETLALIWPEKAHTFRRVLIDGDEVGKVAADMGKSVRTVQRLIYGHEDDSGAMDWFLIILELYREADCVHPGCASTLDDCFKPAVSGPVKLAADPTEYSLNPLGVPFHRPLFAAVLEAFANGYSDDLVKSFPWESSHRVVAWPYLGEPAPLERSTLPGLLAAMRRCERLEDRFLLCLLVLALAYLEQGVPSPPFPGTHWARLLRVLNTGGSREVAQCGEIPHHHVQAATGSSQPLLHSLPDKLKYAALGIFSRTPLSKSELGNYAQDGRFAFLSALDDLRYCVIQCFG